MPEEEDISVASDMPCASHSVAPTSLPLRHDNDPMSPPPMDSPASSDLKRLSKDSGTGTDLEGEMGPGQIGRTSSIGRNSDSGN